ncbi:hypothetical protein BDP27DRAFT_1433275 [Rhodocollybia butyracea]|uniref:Uncharacterized protein n=1 Tax=Rhodocollybia butyracea TaxID=206335 RepID=A0A9P5TWX9_9AGAR|nr:hypothetical protein BDP27DRAFT_1433275 [Rhodocollybia butyracea]
MVTSDSIGKQGKKGKRFLDQSDALKLAASIVETREKKIQTSAKKHQQPTQVQGTPKKNSLKAKLKEIKAQIASDKALLKKNKARIRKEATPQTPVLLAEKKDPPPLKKRVSFA